MKQIPLEKLSYSQIELYNHGQDTGRDVVWMKQWDSLKIRGFHLKSAYQTLRFGHPLIGFDGRTRFKLVRSYIRQAFKVHRTTTMTVHPKVAECSQSPK